jgi:hypothetical protein
MTEETAPENVVAALAEVGGDLLPPEFADEAPDVEEDA